MSKAEDARKARTPAKFRVRRDGQRGKLYVAESEAGIFTAEFMSFKKQPKDQEMTPLDALGQMRGIVGSSWFQKRFPHVPSRVQPFALLQQDTGRVRKNALQFMTSHIERDVPKALRDKYGRCIFVVWRRGYGGRADSAGHLFPTLHFGITDGNLSPGLLLHEIAHLAAPELCAHSRYFAKTYLMLVERFCGLDAARALRGAFVKHGVKHTLPKVLSKDTMQAARERGSLLAAVGRGSSVESK